MGVTPRNMALYERAFRHVSVPHEHSRSYENLEFLGDAVIGLLVADYLLRTIPGEQVGRLTRLRSHTVNQDTLSTLAKDLGFEEYIDIEHSKIRDREGIEDSVLADTFESIVGAIYLDRGMRAAKNFAMEHMLPVLVEAINAGDLIDHKSYLQEYLQSRFKEIPRYRRISAKGPDHAQVFTVECVFQGKMLSKGAGTSLKKAEQDAARKALRKYRKGLSKSR